MRITPFLRWLSVSTAFFSLLAGTLPVQAVVNDATQPTWSQQNRSVASWSKSDAPTYATDHILVKRSGQSVQSVPVPAGQSVADTVSKWSKQSGVEYAEPDGLMHALGQTTTWGWSDVKADTAVSTNGATGSGVIVAVVDSGVDYNHEDLANNMWVNTGETPNNGIDDDGNGYIDDYHGYDFIGSLYTTIAPDNDPQDEAGHGTHVAGIIAAENNALGVRGVATGVKIMPVKVLDIQGTGFDSDIVSGIEYAVDNGANIINLSLGSSTASNALKAGIDYAVAHNVLVVAAAGNEYSFSKPSYPAAYDSVVSVGAITEDGFKADFSNWGKVDVVAPGDDINSTIPGNLYARYSGTSMASPFVAGVAALVMQKQGTTGNPKATRHVLETTATDFSIYSGSDYVSGYGKVNALAATGTLAASAYLHADTGFVVTNGSSDAAITVSVRNAANAAVSGATVTWATDKGTLSAVSSTTNSSGEATVTFTADDVAGVATITADTASTEPTHIQIALLNDVVKPLQIGVSPYNKTTTEDQATTETSIQGGGGEITPITTTDDSTSSSTTLSYNEYQPGDMITFWADPTAFDWQTHTVTMTYSVTDPTGAAVSDLSGTSAQTDVGQDFYGWFYLPQTNIVSKPLTIPSDAATGKYTETVIITDVDSGEASTRSSNFWVGELPSILVVDNNNYCFDTPVEGLDFGFTAYCSGASHIVADTLSSLGYDSMIWDTTQTSTPTADDLKKFPIVIWLDSSFAFGDNSLFQSYLDAGGNLLLSSESTATYATTNGQPSAFLWNYLHARYASTLMQPNVVSGIAGTDFAGQLLNIDTYNLNSDASRNMYQAEELEVNTTDDAEAIFAYNQGTTTTRAAGVRFDSGTYRMAYLTFNLGAINNDLSGYVTRASVIDNLVTWLQGTAPTIRKVTGHKPLNNADRTITIHGDGFQMTGATTVQLRGRTLNDVVVVDRNTITATVPAGLDAKKYSITVTNPDGRTTSRSKAVHVQVGGPYVSNFSSTVLSNNHDRKLVLTGSHFTANSEVLLGGQMMTTKYTDPTSLTVTVPAGFKTGHLNLIIKNPATKLHLKMKQAVQVRYGFTDDLKLGSTGKAVKALEYRLVSAGFFTGKPDHSFTETTMAAVALYQQSVSIPQTGVVDELTRYYLNNK